MQALQTSPAMVRLILIYGRRSATLVVLLPIARPSTLLGLIVSRLERPAMLQVFDEVVMARGINRLIIPDNTRAAARFAGRVGPLRTILLLPVALVGLFTIVANARMLPELRVFKLFCTRVGFGVISTIVTVWGDLGPLVPLPDQFSSSRNPSLSGATEVDLSRQDLPRIALLRRGERQDLVFLAFLYALFVSLCVQNLVVRQHPRFR
jgi:hypothetical protein